MTNNKEPYNKACYNDLMARFKKQPVDGLAKQRNYEASTARQLCAGASATGCAGGVASGAGSGNLMPREEPMPAYDYSRSTNLFTNGRWEPFDGDSCLPDMRTLLKWVIIGLIVYLIMTLVTDSQRAPVMVPISFAQGGGSMSISEFDINF
jgi:hypothetical protein